MPDQANVNLSNVANAQAALFVMDAGHLAKPSVQTRRCPQSSQFGIRKSRKQYGYERLGKSLRDLDYA